MPVRIRLQRHGKKGKPFYWIVAADGRAKRDGRYLEKIGVYNPNTNPATVELNVDQAVKWLENGAQPSDTARTLLSYRGVMMKHHLNGGVRKGAFSQEEADKRFDAWLSEKQAKIQAKIDGLDKDQANALAQRLEAEKAVNQKRIADLVAAPEEETSDATDSDETTESTEKAESTEVAAAEAEVGQEEAAAVEEAAPEVEEPKVEETPAEVAKSEETPAAEAAPEVEEPKAEETPAEESKGDEAPAQEEETKE
jgi:small subunit ribosomal protein S16